jgi:hypothetical protein
VTLLTALAAVPAAQGASPQQVIDILNGQRVANGIPGVVEDPALSHACELHNRYLRLNPGVYPHRETPGRPGYTQEGALIAPNSALMGPSPEPDPPSYPFDSGRNPFQAHPFHLAGLLRPGLVDTGANESNRWTCVATGGLGRTGPRSMRFYTYPGPRRTGVPVREVVFNERPYSPGDLVGIPQGTASGPHLYLFGFGLTASQLRIRSASLNGPTGKTALRWVDSTHPRTLLDRLDAILIPRDPLDPGAYCVSVRGTVRGVGHFGHRWPFVTDGSTAAPPRGCVAPPPAGLRLLSAKQTGTRVRVRVGVNVRTRGRLRVTLNAGPGPRRLSKAGPSRRQGSSRVYTFAGTMPPSAPGARWVILEVRYSRTDGGTDARTGKALPVRG